MNELEAAKEKAATTYNAAADYFDHPANSFWARYGRRTIERLGLKSGERGFKTSKSSLKVAPNRQRAQVVDF